MSTMTMLATMSGTFGFPPVTREVPGPHDCPKHNVTLETHQLSTFSGWWELDVCPQFDSTCSYDPEGTPVRIDQPDEVTEAAVAAAKAAQKAANEAAKAARDSAAALVLDPEDAPDQAAADQQPST